MASKESKPNGNLMFNHHILSTVAFYVKSKNVYCKHLNKKMDTKKIIICGGTVVVELWRMNSKHLRR